jgi:hypothetical protein
MSPSIDQTLALLGREVTVSRLKQAMPEFELVLSKRG